MVVMLLHDEYVRNDVNELMVIILCVLFIFIDQ